LLFYSRKVEEELLEASSYYWQDYIANGHLQHTRDEVFYLVYFVIFLFKYFNHKVNFIIYLILLFRFSYLDLNLEYLALEKL
jgi:hypothetical protein